MSFSNGLGELGLGEMGGHRFILTDTCIALLCRTTSNIVVSMKLWRRLTNALK